MFVYTVRFHFHKSCSEYVVDLRFRAQIWGTPLWGRLTPCRLYRSVCTLSPLSRVGRVLIKLVPFAASSQFLWRCSLLSASNPFILFLCPQHCFSPSWKCLVCLHCLLFILSAVFIFPVRSKRYFSSPNLPGWLSDPFTFLSSKKKLSGRGVSHSRSSSVDVKKMCLV